MKKLYVVALLLIISAILIACKQYDTGTQAGTAAVGGGCGV